MAPVPQPRFLRSGDTALVVEFGDSVDPDISARVLSLAGLIEAEAIPGVVEVVPTFRSLMVHYEPLALPHADLERRLGSLIGRITVEEQPGRRLVHPRVLRRGRRAGPRLCCRAHRLVRRPGYRAAQRHRVPCLHDGLPAGLSLYGWPAGGTRTAAPREPAPARAVGLAGHRHDHDHHLLAGKSGRLASAGAHAGPDVGSRVAPSRRCWRPGTR